MPNEYLAGNQELVDGIYPLGALIARSVRGTIYETEFGEGADAVPAVIRIWEVEPAEAEILEERLRRVAQLEHPNLLRIYGAGASTLNGVPVLYVVMERAEESLQSVLAERALTVGETREMLAPTLDALAWLHRNGYAHSRLRPSNVLAVNDQLKLSTDCVVSGMNNMKTLAAEDMRALGAVIVQALTRKIPNPDRPWEFHDFGGIPQPLADIARHCLDPDRETRWTVEQVKDCLNAPVVVPSQGSRVEDDIPQPEEENEAPAVSRPGVSKWIYAGLAALVLIVILVAVLRNNGSPPVADRVAAVAQRDQLPPAFDPATADPATVAPTRPEPRQSPTVPPPQITPAPRVQTPARPSERKASGWAVIVGAYRSRELAEKRIRELAKRWPNFPIGIFESPGERTTYLLLLGRNLSEEQAQTLRKRAIKSRVPGDIYIKRLM